MSTAEPVLWYVPGIDKDELEDDDADLLYYESDKLASNLVTSATREASISVEEFLPKMGSPQSLHEQFGKSHRRAGVCLQPSLSFAASFGSALTFVSCIIWL